MQSDALQTLIDTTPVVIIASKLTDTRTLERRLGLVAVDFRIVILGMGSAEHRASFEMLRERSGWAQLPLIFVHGRCIGGEPELLAHPLLNPGSRLAWALGLASLAPLLLGALGSHLQIGLVGPHLFDATLAYAVLMLAFISGAQWGGAVNARGLRTRRRYLTSAIPPFVIWPAWLVGPVPALAVLVTAFAATLFSDISWGRRHAWPWWYLRLRAVVTATAMAALLVMLEAVPS